MTLETLFKTVPKPLYSHPNFEQQDAVHCVKTKEGLNLLAGWEQRNG